MTTQTDLDVASHKVVRDERVKERNRLQRMLIRPEWTRGKSTPVIAGVTCWPTLPFARFAYGNCLCGLGRSGID